MFLSLVSLLPVPFFLSLPCISQETALIVTPVAPKHQIVLFWPQNRREMQWEGTEMGFGLQALDFRFGPTISCQPHSDLVPLNLSLEQ